jgi:hypothetical protein
LIAVSSSHILCFDWGTFSVHFSCRHILALTHKWYIAFPFSCPLLSLP